MTGQNRIGYAYDVVLVGHKAYVGNWGGGRPKPADVSGPAGGGTEVKEDPVRNVRP
jgi:hypothetical protein